MAKQRFSLLGLLVALSCLPLASQAQDPPARMPLRLHGQVGGSLWGNARYDLPQAQSRDRGLTPALDARVGVSLLLHRFFSIESAFGYSRWQTEYFESYARARSRSLHLRAGPALRVPAQTGHSGEGVPSFFTSVSAGPAFSFVSEDVLHVKVSEQNTPKTGWVAAWALGMDVPLQKHFGFRVEADLEWLAVHYRSELQGPGGTLGHEDFSHLLRRPIVLVGIWLTP